MNDKELIEELAEIQCAICKKYTGESEDCNSAECLSLRKKCANGILNAGYRKIPEGGCVLSKDNYNRLKRDSELYEARREKKLKLFAKAYNQGSNETAMVFAEKLENGIDNLDIILHEDNDEQYVSVNQLFEFIDEIAKQFGVEIKEQENESSFNKYPTKMGCKNYKRAKDY